MTIYDLSRIAYSMGKLAFTEGQSPSPMAHPLLDLMAGQSDEGWVKAYNAITLAFTSGFHDERFKEEQAAIKAKKARF